MLIARSPSTASGRSSGRASSSALRPAARRLPPRTLAKTLAWLSVFGLMGWLALAAPEPGSKRVLIFAPGLGQEEIMSRIVALGGLPVGEMGLAQAKLVAFDQSVGRLDLLSHGVVMALTTTARGCISLPEPPPRRLSTGAAAPS